MPYDIRPVSRAKISDLSKTIFENEYLPTAVAPEVLAQNERTYEQQLASCKMIVSPDDPAPTVLGILTTGKTVRDFIPCSYIQFLRIDGTELTDEVTDEGIMDGTISEMLRATIEKFRSYNRVSVDVSSASTHKIKPLYPEAAVTQILYNAVQHRIYEGTNSPVRFNWYNDRIEIISPGGPYGSVTTDNFGKPGYSDYRNQNISSVMKELGFVQSFGRGIGIARKSMQENGNPEVEFYPNQSMVTCVLRSKPA